jgi:hypothetical protein
VHTTETDDKANDPRRETPPPAAHPEYGAAPQEFPEGWDEFVVARSRYLRARDLPDASAPGAGTPEVRSRFASTRQRLLS